MPPFTRRLPRYFNRFSKNFLKSRQAQKASLQTEQKQLLRVVNSAISRKKEKKTQSFNLSGLTLYNVSNDLSGWRTNNVYCVGPFGTGTVGPVVSQGVGQGDRIGNQIRITKATLKGVFYPNSENSNTDINLIDANIYIIRGHEAQTVSEIENIVENDMFQDGDTDLGLVGTLADNILPINKDKINLYKHKIYKVGWASNNVPQANNDYKVNRHFSMDLTKYINKVQKFNDTSDFPSNPVTWLVFSPVPANNTLGGPNADTCKVTFSITIEYTDA